MNQHFIPKAYLKFFENSQRKLFSLPNRRSESLPKIKDFSRTQIGYFPDFYTVKNPVQLNRLGFSDPDEIEKKLNSLAENKYGKLIRRLKTRPSTITLQEAEEIILILLSFKQRNPVYRKTLDNPKLLLDVFNRRLEMDVLPNKLILNDILEREGVMNFDEFLEYGRNHFQKVANNPNTPQDLHIEGIANFHNKDESVVKSIADALMKADWFIFETPASCPFITSDNPGFCIDSNERIQNLSFRDCLSFVFPLTPESILLIADFNFTQPIQHKAINYQQATYDLVSNLNRGTYIVSYKRALSSDANTLRHVWHDMDKFIRETDKS